MKHQFALFFALAAFLIPAAPVKASPDLSDTFSSFDPTCKASLLVDATSGRVLQEYNANTPLRPASMVKIFTAYMVLKAAEDGQISLDDVVTTSARASKTGGSQVYLKHKEEFTVQQLLEALLIQSANDGAIALAEHIGGSVEGFVALMNAEAIRLGLENTSFSSPHGLPPDGGEEPDLMSAKDVAEISQVLIKKYPSILEITGTNEKAFRDGTFGMRNHNDLLRRYRGVDGIKTGYYRKAGFCVAATATRGNARLIAITMGCDNKRQRFQDTSSLFTLGFSLFKQHDLIEPKAVVEVKAPVSNGKQSQVALSAKDTVSATLLESDVSRVEKLVEPCSSLTAPVQVGQTCGQITFKLDDSVIGKSELVVANAVEKATLLDKALGIFR